MCEGEKLLGSIFENRSGAETMMDFNEVARIINDKKSRYERFLKILKDLFINYHHSSEGRKVIYRVASRGDYQQGDEIKPIQSIQRKIKDKIEKEKDKAYTIFNVDDIIGIRLICIYPSDIDTVVAFIRNQNGKDFRILQDLPKEKALGYRAHHFVVESTKTELTNIRSEIQIMTMLQETWSFKTHGLIYKGREAKEIEQRQSKLLSEALKVVDEQSELLKQQILERKEAEQRRRNVAKTSFLEELAEAQLRSLNNKKQRTDLEQLKKNISENEEELSYGNINKTGIIDQIFKYKKKYGLDIYLCRIMASLAAIRDMDDLNSFALDCINELIANSTGIEKGKAITFKSLILYCFERLEDAISEAQKALRLGEELPDKSLIDISKANISYFIAELGDKVRENVARRYIDEVVKENPTTGHFLDTKGYVLITFGKNIEEVKEGLTMCERFFEQNRSSKRAETYFKLHQHKAFEKLVELSA